MVFWAQLTSLVPAAVLATLAGLGVGVGIVLAICGWRGHQIRPHRENVSVGSISGRANHRLWWCAGVAGLLVLLITRWVAPALVTTVAIALWPRLFGAVAAERAAIDRLEGLAVWAEALRDTMSSGSGLLEALRATAARPPASLAEPLTALASRLNRREPLEQSLRHLAEDINDPAADQVVAALVLNARAQGRQLRVVLASLADSTRRSVRTRRDIAADRRTVRQGVQIIMCVVMAVIVGMTLFAPHYVEAYRTPVGQLVMVVIMGFFAAGFMVLRQLAIIRTPTRFLEVVTP